MSAGPEQVCILTSAWNRRVEKGEISEQRPGRGSGPALPGRNAACDDDGRPCHWHMLNVGQAETEGDLSQRATPTPLPVITQHASAQREGLSFLTQNASVHMLLGCMKSHSSYTTCLVRVRSLCLSYPSLGELFWPSAVFCFSSWHNKQGGKVGVAPQGVDHEGRGQNRKHEPLGLGTETRHPVSLSKFNKGSHYHGSEIGHREQLSSSCSVGRFSRGKSQPPTVGLNRGNIQAPTADRVEGIASLPLQIESSRGNSQPPTADRVEGIASLPLQIESRRGNSQPPTADRVEGIASLPLQIESSRGNSQPPTADRVEGIASLPLQIELSRGNSQPPTADRIEGIACFPPGLFRCRFISLTPAAWGSVMDRKPDSPILPLAKQAGWGFPGCAVRPRIHVEREREREERKRFGGRDRIVDTAVVDRTVRAVGAGCSMHCVLRTTTRLEFGNHPQSSDDACAESGVFRSSRCFILSYRVVLISLETGRKPLLFLPAMLARTLIPDECTVVTRHLYIERKNFLERVDLRQFEQEKNVRLSNMKRLFPAALVLVHCACSRPRPSAPLFRSVPRPALPAVNAVTQTLRAQPSLTCDGHGRGVTCPLLLRAQHAQQSLTRPNVRGECARRVCAASVRGECASVASLLALPWGTMSIMSSLTRLAVRQADTECAYAQPLPIRDFLQFECGNQILRNKPSGMPRPAPAQAPFLECRWGLHSDACWDKPFAHWRNDRFPPFLTISCYSSLSSSPSSSLPVPFFPSSFLLLLALSSSIQPVLVDLREQRRLNEELHGLRSPGSEEEEEEGSS
ncbi:hypothetical protein JZ751_017004 [Albula glossodonta]|uniref:Craniofacial development protein 1 n=1 Tax=Albula glossodonta TaxID=121402 RepID=A0A8T2MLM1_9TELE|nr:hypothetical protein JZ751_017004 [Albula glossodonta]